MKHDRSNEGIRVDIEMHIQGARSAIAALAEKLDTTRDRLVLSVYYEELNDIEKELTDLIYKVETSSGNVVDISNMMTV